MPPIKTVDLRKETTSRLDTIDGQTSPINSRNLPPPETVHAESKEAAVGPTYSHWDDEEKVTPLASVKTMQYADNDPDDPHSWSMVRKVFLTAIIAANAFIGTFSSSAITPGFDDIVLELGCSSELAVLAYSVFVLGLAVGAPFASPASETFGRKAVYLVCLPVFAIFIVGTGFSQNIWSLIITRFFAGVFASPAQSAGSASIADVWPSSHRVIPMTLFVLTPFFAPSLAPMINGFVVVSKGWRWTSWTIVFFTIAALIPTCFMGETHKQTILRRRAKRLAIGSVAADANETLDAKSDIHPWSYWTGRTRSFISQNLDRPLNMLFTEPVVAAFSIYVAFNFSLVYAFFAAFPFVWQSYYGYGITSTGLMFLGLCVGAIVDFPIFIAVDRLHYAPRTEAVKARLLKEGASSQTITAAKPPPETRLFPAKLGGPMLPAALFLFGWTAAYHVHWLVPVVAEALFGAGNMLVFASATLYIVEVYGAKFGASAMAANTMLRYVLGAAFPLVAVQMFAGMGVQWACSLLGCVSIVLAGVPFVLCRYGERLRHGSAYAQPIS